MELYFAQPLVIVFVGLEDMLCVVKHVTVNELNELVEAIVNVCSRAPRS